MKRRYSVLLHEMGLRTRTVEVEVTSDEVENTLSVTAWSDAAREKAHRLWRDGTWPDSNEEWDDIDLDTDMTEVTPARLAGSSIEGNLE